MPPLSKPELEFTPILNSNGVFSSKITSISNTDGSFTSYKTYTLSLDPTTGDKTVYKEHAPGSVWGGNPSDNFDKDTTKEDELAELLLGHLVLDEAEEMANRSPCVAVT
ncbi:hypothetical protein N7474_004458 [Penicillium riverlandense]|uniref:uncharacterized protein n=1 Tax=Penicillium riverlandense TaxID=1903569 RepID=UPI0025489434|nr:uncharacterized protein N7474_004458 [Penicillium riverlandense]KAJ5818867.1 hypothetical protein N7474_004458 [Penicillium riverlandense]